MILSGVVASGGVLLFVYPAMGTIKVFRIVIKTKKEARKARSHRMPSFNGRIAVSTSVFYKTTIFEAIELIHTAGYKHVEIFAKENHFPCDNAESVDRVKNELTSRALVPVSFHAPFGRNIDIAATGERERGYAVWLMKQALQAAATIGCLIVVMHTSGHAANTPHEAEQLLIQLQKTLNEILPVADRLGVKVALENITPNYIGGDLNNLVKLAKKYGKMGVGICLDTSHAHLWTNITEFIWQAGGNIITTHISDNKKQHDAHMPPGGGSINWPEVLAVMNAVGYNGFFTLELIRPNGYRGSWNTFLRRAGYALKNRLEVTTGISA